MKVLSTNRYESDFRQLRPAEFYGYECEYSYYS